MMSLSVLFAVTFSFEVHSCVEVHVLLALFGIVRNNLSKSKEINDQTDFHLFS